MTTNNFKKGISLVLAVTMVGGNVAYADSLIKKEETVYVDLEETGREKEIISSIWIHSKENLGEFKDKINLKDVKNVKGEEEPKKDGEDYLWKVEDKELFYQGKSEDKLPIETKITYKLNGKVVDPKEIAGEDGRLEITIELVNRDERKVQLKSGENRTIYTPYIVGTVVDLPKENFKNVETNGGKLLSDGSEDLLSFLSIPGLEDSLGMDEGELDISNTITIRADVEEFNMKPIIIGVTPEVPELDILDDAKDLDSLLDGLDELEEAGKKLVEATEELKEGQKALGEGIGQLSEGSSELSKGAKELDNGSNKLSTGIKEAATGSETLVSAGKELEKGGKEIKGGYTALGQGMENFSSKSSEFTQGISKLTEELKSIPNLLGELVAGIKDMITGTDKLIEGQENLNQGFNSIIPGVEKLKSGKVQEKEGINNILLSMDQMEELAAAVGNLEGGEELAIMLQEGIKTQKAGLEALNSSSQELINGLENIGTGLSDMENGSKELEQGLKELNQGQKTMYQELEGSGANFNELEEATKKLEEGSKGLEAGSQELVKNVEKLNAGVDTLGAGGKEFLGGASDLALGLRELDKGSLALNSGIGELSIGAEKLSQGTKELQEGSNLLVEGTEELNKGVSKIEEEGRDKLEDKLNSGELKIGEVIEVKDKLIELSKENNSFSGIKEGMDGKVKYIMKTEEVKYEKPVEVEEIEEEKGEGFLDRIKNLFK